jgi:hypothetical protein
MSPITKKKSSLGPIARFSSGSGSGVTVLTSAIPEW